MHGIDHRDLMLATPAAKPFDRPGWIFELKYDGFRVLAIRDGDKARLLSRRGNDLAAYFPEIVACLWTSAAPSPMSPPSMKDRRESEEHQDRGGAAPREMDRAAMS